MPKWIDESCFFTRDQTLATLKPLLPADVVKDLGFVCPPDGKWSNQELASNFTGIMGTTYHLLDEAPCNTTFGTLLTENQSFTDALAIEQNFVNALWAGPFCNIFANRFYSATDDGTGSVSLTLPAGGTYRGNVIVLGNEANNRALFINGDTITDSDDDNRMAIRAGDFAGGTTLTISSSEGGEELVMTFFGVRVDCLQ